MNMSILLYKSFLRSLAKCAASKVIKENLVFGSAYRRLRFAEKVFELPVGLLLIAWQALGL